MTEADHRGPQPEYNLDISTSPGFARLDNMYQWFAQSAADYLKKASRLNLIDLTKAKRIVEFGSEIGASTLSLTKLAEQNNGTVTALEINAKDGQEIIDSGVLPADIVYIGDGIEYLKGMHERGEKCDLVAAFFLVPENTETLIPRLLSSTKAVLSPQGHLLVTSDIYTMTAAAKIFDTQGFDSTAIKVGADPFHLMHFGLITSLKPKQIRT